MGEYEVDSNVYIETGATKEDARKLVEGVFRDAVAIHGVETSGQGVLVDFTVYVRGNTKDKVTTELVRKLWEHDVEIGAVRAV